MPQLSLLPRIPARLLALLPAVLTVVLTVMFLVPAGAASREIPVGMSNTADQNLRNSQWLYAIRFVLDRDTTMYRFFSQMKAKGAPWDEHGVTCTQVGPGCYAAGDGGIINVRLVNTKADGTPDLSTVLAQETIIPRTRYFKTKSAYGVSGITLFWYFNMAGVRLDGNTPYAMVYRNLHGDPAHNFSSTNSISVKESEAGPNGRNNLDPDAPGAIRGSTRVRQPRGQHRRQGRLRTSGPPGRSLLRQHDLGRGRAPTPLRLAVFADGQAAVKPALHGLSDELRAVHPDRQRGAAAHDTHRGRRLRPCG